MFVVETTTAWLFSIVVLAFTYVVISGFSSYLQPRLSQCMCVVIVCLEGVLDSDLILFLGALHRHGTLSWFATYGLLPHRIFTRYSTDV